jgi:hypothetical protein
MAIPCRRNNFTEWAHAQAKSSAQSLVKRMDSTRWVYYDEGTRKMWCLMNEKLTRVWAHGVATPEEINPYGWVACSAPSLQLPVEGGFIFEGIIEDGCWEERAIESMTLDHAGSTVAALRAMPSR